MGSKAITPKKKPKLSHGGKREGAGHPKGVPNQRPKIPKKAVTVRLPLALYERLGEWPTLEATAILTEALEKRGAK